MVCQPPSRFFFTYPLANIQKAMERSTMLSMGKSAVSMAIFNSKPLNFSRWLKQVKTTNQPAIPLRFPHVPWGRGGPLWSSPQCNPQNQNGTHRNHGKSLEKWIKLVGKYGKYMEIYGNTISYYNGG